MSKPFVFNSLYKLEIPIMKSVKGADVKEYQPAGQIFCSYSATSPEEKVINGLVLSVDSGLITTWYRPDITTECRLRHPDDDTRVYDIITEPINVNGRSQYLKFKVSRKGGGA